MDNTQTQYFIDCVDKGIKLYWETLAKARGMKLHSEDIEWVMSDDRNGPERIFCIQLSRENAKRRVDEIAGSIKNNALPNGILITPKSEPSDIISLLEAKGFDLDYSSPGMVMELSQLEPCTHQEDKIRSIKVADAGLLRKWVDVVNLDFHIMSYEQFYDLYCLAEVHLYLSFYNDIPVGTFMIIRDGELITVEMVNTLKEYQKKGIATAALTQILYECKSAGVCIATLRSSIEGIHLYTKIGFKECCKRVLATYE